MDASFLRHIGLTEGESKVYLALLKRGSSTTGPIVDEAGVARSKIYHILERLITKGLVTIIIKSQVKYYQAVEPSRLLTYIDSKEQELENDRTYVKSILPQLEAYKQEGGKEDAEIYRGLEGVKTARELALKTLKRGETFYVLGGNRINQLALKAYWGDFHERRKKLGIKAKYIIQEDARDTMGKDPPYSEGKKYLMDVKFFDLPGPVHIDIFGDYVVTCIMQGTLVSFLIKNKYVAEYYRNYFNRVWEAAKP